MLWRYLRRVMRRYGFGRFPRVPIWSTGKAAARYFAKYVTKAFASREQDDKGTRRWFAWGDARRAKCSFAFIGSQSRHKIGWMASVLGFQWYDDFKENLGPRWAYYLFPLLDRVDWDEARDAVWVTACLLRDGFWKQARWLANVIASPKISESGVVGVSVLPWRVFGNDPRRFPSISEGITYSIRHSVSVLLPFIVFARLFGVISA